MDRALTSRLERVGSRYHWMNQWISEYPIFSDKAIYIYIFTKQNKERKVKRQPLATGHILFPETAGSLLV
jgi:hypothetical protein